ncbi:hypothetical protein ACHAXT_012621 [Thalassiosira profunda]
MAHPSRRRPRPPPSTAGRAAVALSWPLLAALGVQSAHLDVHIPLPQGCLKYEALRANRLLRQASGRVRKGAAPHPTEGVDLFSDHTAHVTLYLAEFDMEEVNAPEQENGANSEGAETANALNQTKVDAFLGAISSVDFHQILNGWKCPLSFAPDATTSNYYTVNGGYTMLPVQNTPCLQSLSTALLHKLQSFLKQPIVVPDWVASLPEPQRSAAIYRSRMYGSPNVLEGFAPHVTVGYDPIGENSTTFDREWREEALGRWNEEYKAVRETCVDEVRGVAVGRTGRGGTVLAGTRLGYWELKGGSEEEGGSAMESLETEEKSGIWEAIA